MNTITKALWGGAILLFILGVWPVALLIALIATIVTLSERKKAERSYQDKELEHQREIERKEIDMVRKSNDILIRLIQDKHRGEDR